MKKTSDSILNLILLLSFAFICSQKLQAQTIVVGWNNPMQFGNTDNATYWFDPIADMGIAGNTGVSKMLTFGGVTNATASTWFIDGNTVICNANIFPYANTWANGSGTKGWVFNFATTNLGTLKFSGKMSGTLNTSINWYGPLNFKLQYSLNNSTWTDVSGGAITAAIDNNTNYCNLRSLTDVNLPVACENQAKVYLRMLMTSNMSVDETHLVTAGNSIIDEFIVTGFPLPGPPAVTTSAATSITSVSANGRGNITWLGFPNPTAYGVCWNTTGTPLISDFVTNKGAASTLGNFSAAMTGLTPGTTYFVRAFVTNTSATVYGDQVSITTTVPSITSATYDAVSGSMVVTGLNFQKKTGVFNDISASKLTLTGEGSLTYTLTSADVETTSATLFTVILNETDKAAINQIINKNSTSSTGGTIYNLAAADDWCANIISGNIKDATSPITASNVAIPGITNATYDAITGTLIVTGTGFLNLAGAANDIITNKLTITGEGGLSYTLTSDGVEFTSGTSFTVTLNGTDKTAVNQIVNKNGASSTSGTTYNLAAAENWAAGADAAVVIADLAGNGISVSNVAVPAITSATYNAATGSLVVTGTGLSAKSGAANDIDVSKLTIRGEGGATYTLTSAGLEITSGASFTVTLNVTDKTAVNQIVNKNGTVSTGATIYNLAAAEDWAAGADAAVVIADLAGNGISVSNVAVPAIASATYNAATGSLVVTGTGLSAKSGAANDIDVSKLTIRGEGGATYTLTSASAEIMSGTSFTVTLNGTDKTAVNQIVNKNGTVSTGATIYNLAAAEDWAAGADLTVVVADLTGNGITVTGLALPTVTTQAVNSLTTTTATGNGTITNLGVPNPTTYGICWNTSGTPTTDDNKNDKGAASVTGVFTASMASLSPNTTYYARAYATNTSGTRYGSEVAFTTYPLPTVSFTPSNQSSAGETGIMEITAELSEVSIADVTVPFTVNGSSTATGNSTDYSITASPITITAGKTTGTITITIATDAMDEYDETVVVDMGTPTNATRGAMPTHTAIITDDDNVPFVTLSATPLPIPVSISEASGISTVTATISVVSAKPISVDLGFTGTAAGSGTDYNVSGNTISIAPGNLTGSISLSAVQDLLPELNETVITDIVSGLNCIEDGPQQSTIAIVDDDFATVRSLSSTTLNGRYKAGDVIDITVTFTFPVVVTGIPQLTLETGTTDRIVNYTGGSGTSILTLNYTVQAGDASADLDYISTSAFTLNSGTIKDVAGKNATLTLAAPGTANSLGNNKAIVVDAVLPTVSSVSSITPNGTYKKGANISIQVNFTETVIVLGTPQLTFETGTTDQVVNYASGSGSGTLNFTYTVEAGDVTADFDYQSATALALNGGSIKDAAGNNATLTLAVPGTANSLGNNKDIVIGLVPEVTTEAVSDITITTATGNGNITDLGFPNPTQYGVVWSTISNPTVALLTKTTQGVVSMTGAFTSDITGLSPGTTYYVKAYATNSAGIRYGNEVSLTTSPATTTISGTTNWSTGAQWDNGIPGSSSNAVIGAGTIAVDGNYTVNNLTLNPDGALTIGPGKTLTVTGNLILSSNGTHTASLIIDGSLFVLGTTTVERHMLQNKWYIVSPTVSGQSIAGFLTANTNIPGTDSRRALQEYNTGLNGWSDYFTTTTQGMMNVGKGYTSRVTSTGHIDFMGALTWGNIDIPVTRNGDNGWNCIGNPYTSAININVDGDATNNFITANAGNLDPNYSAIYIWDELDNSGSQNYYKVISNAAFTLPNTALVQNRIQVGQGFLVKVKDSPTNVSFTPAMQLHQTGLALKSAATSWPAVELSVKSDDQSAYTAIAYNDKMTPGLDPSFDAGLLRGSNGLTIYSRLINDTGVDFAIQCLPENQMNNLVIALGLDYDKGGEVKISAQSVELPTGTKVILEDKVLKSFTTLGNGIEYKASVEPNTKGIGRFYLHASNQIISGLNNAVLAGKLSAYAIRNIEIRIIGEVGTEAVATLYDIQGRVVLIENLKEGNLNMIPTSAIKSGVYMLSVKDDGKLQTFKLMIRE